MHLETYLTFEGNCREAFEFYRGIFGGEFTFVLTFGEGPPDLNIPDEEKDLIMPMQDQFWGAYFGRLTDKFGINWMISFDATEQQ